MLGQFIIIVIVIITIIISQLKLWVNIMAITHHTKLNSGRPWEERRFPRKALLYEQVPHGNPRQVQQAAACLQQSQQRLTTSEDASTVYVYTKKTKFIFVYVYPEALLFTFYYILV